MTFSPEWNAVYSDNKHLSIWPWSDLVSYFNRYAQPFSPKTRVLEIGFGAGANIPFFESINVDYSGIEGSQTICNAVALNFPNLAQKLFIGDFLTHDFSEKFDVIVDRASMTHNSTSAIKKGLSHLADYLNPGGKYIGIDWFSTKHSDYLIGDIVDEYTRTNISSGSFAGIGNVHFSDENHIHELFKDFEIISLEEKQSHRLLPSNGHIFASWNIAAIKR